MSFGKTIKRLRRERDMTQDELAEILSISPQAVSSDRVDALDKTVTKLLRDAGVTDEWKNHTDLKPFSAA